MNRESLRLLVVPLFVAGLVLGGTTGQAQEVRSMGAGTLLPSPSSANQLANLGPAAPPLDGLQPDSEVWPGVLSEGEDTQERVFSNGLQIDGPFSFTIDSSGVDMSVGRVANATSQTSGTLELWLWATPSQPVFGQNNPGYKLAFWRPNTWHGPNGDRLKAGFQVSNIALNNLAYNPPPAGCYYISTMLVEWSGGQFFYQDFFVYPQSPYGLSGGSCGGGGGVQPCTQNLSQGVICLRNGRFELSMTWTGFDNQTQPVIFQKHTDEVALGVFQNNINDVTLSAKVTNGCPVNGNYWVWLGAFTASELNLAVRDTVTGQTRSYGKSLSGLMTTVKDDFTFPCN